MKRKQEGQTIAVVALAITVLFGVVALTLDAGSWFRDHRHQQAIADSAALAAASALPNQGLALARAQEWAGKNDGTLSNVAFPAFDQVEVVAQNEPPGIFSRLFGFHLVTTKAEAAARYAIVTTTTEAVPWAVNATNQWLQCTPNPCTTSSGLNYIQFHHPGSGKGTKNSFVYIDYSGSTTSDPTYDQIAEWIANGYGTPVGLGPTNLMDGQDFICSDGKSKDKSTTGITVCPVSEAINSKIGSVVLVAVVCYKGSAPACASADTIVGWAGFRITGVDYGGGTEHHWKVFGTFEPYAFGSDEVPTSGATGPAKDFGARAIALVK
jgi:hypothetical protein